MTFGVALEVLRKEYKCRIATRCPDSVPVNSCNGCDFYTDSNNVTEALKTVLDTFGNHSELSNSSDCISRPTDEAAFWEKRAKEYSDIVNDLVYKMAKGVKFDTIVMNEEELTLKQAEHHWTPCEKELPNSSDDCVSRRAVIDRINWWFGILKQNPDILIDAIKTMPSVQAEQKWIPCSEQMPNKPDMYTVTDSKGDVVRFVFDNNESSREYWKRCAKAWMPLPEPYRGDKE